MIIRIINRVIRIIKNREKNEIINFGVDKDKDIEGYVDICNEIVDNKLEFVNKISKLFDNAIEKKEFTNIKDDVLKLIGNSCICDVKKKAIRKIIILIIIIIIKKKIVMIAKMIIIKIIMMIMIMIMII